MDNAQVCLQGFVISKCIRWWLLTDRIVTDIFMKLQTLKKGVVQGSKKRRANW